MNQKIHHVIAAQGMQQHYSIFMSFAVPLCGWGSYFHILVSRVYPFYNPELSSEGHELNWIEMTNNRQTNYQLLRHQNKSDTIEQQKQTSYFLEKHTLSYIWVKTNKKHKLVSSTACQPLLKHSFSCSLAYSAHQFHLGQTRLLKLVQPIVVFALFCFWIFFGYLLSCIKIL